MRSRHRLWRFLRRRLTPGEIAVGLLAAALLALSILAAGLDQRDLTPASGADTLNRYTAGLGGIARQE